jgi:hypothetical protein
MPVADAPTTEHLAVVQLIRTPVLHRRHHRDVRAGLALANAGSVGDVAGPVASTTVGAATSPDRSSTT